MRVWMKNLIIGWSIVSVGVVIVSFQLMKSDHIQEDYDISMEYKIPEKLANPYDQFDPSKKGTKVLDKAPGEWEIVAEDLFRDYKSGIDFPEISKKDFVDRMKKAKGVTIKSKSKVDKAIYMILPIYAFFVWCIPILVFSLVGVIFGRGKGNQMKEEPGK